MFLRPARLSVLFGSEDVHLKQEFFFAFTNYNPFIEENLLYLLYLFTFNDSMFRRICYTPDNNSCVETTACNHVRIWRPCNRVYSSIMETPFSIMRQLRIKYIFLNLIIINIYFRDYIFNLYFYVIVIHIIWTLNWIYVTHPLVIQ